MPREKRRLGRPFLAATWISCAILLLAVLVLISNRCRAIDPSLYVTADVLYPGPEVQIIGYTPEGHTIVNEAFILWIDELKAEIRRLRNKFQ